MKLGFFGALLISFLALPPVLSAQDGLLQPETQKLVNSLKESTDLSSEQKIKKYKSLIQKQNPKSSLNNSQILILKQALLSEMSKIGTYVEITTFFESSTFLKGIDKNIDNINVYARLLVTTANAYLMLEEYDNAKTLLAELKPYLSIYAITDANKGSIFMSSAQLNIRMGQYKEGIFMLRLAMLAIEKSLSLSDLDKRTKISRALIYLGNVYYTLGDFRNAIKYYEKSINQHGEFSDPTDIIVYNHNIAISHLYLAEWEQALNKANIAYKQAKNIESAVFIAFTNEVIARAKYALGNGTEAVEIIHVSIDTYRKLNYLQRLIEALGYEAEFNISLGNWNEAKANTIEAHMLLKNSKNQAKPSVELLKSSFLIEEYNKNFDKALFYQKQLTKIKDEDYEVHKKQDVQRLMLNFELDLAEEKSLRLEQENKLKSAIIESNQRKNQFLISVITGTILMLILLLYLSIRERSLKLKMSQLAMTDDLTGCPNRRNAMYQAKVMLSNQVNKKGSMIIAILDVDNFKAINDTYGHDIGDKALQNLTLIVTDALRETDVIGRYGGEEFIILLPNAGEKEIRMIFSRIQSALKNHICEYNGGNLALPITVSIGATIVSHVPDELAEKEQKLLLHNIIKKADNKTYEAKEEGKDQLKLDTLTDFT
jgi:diguanylate cyclase (GGDEF)-like protein